ncbi:hypothetical protein Egran_03321 [Elaphomyces granulatus]|uniref:Uncharacterized protein n=1 Tax=Elaphomyces granulatus TaxID=519963 RepID=A0A232LXM6_9EURO|nr:hypothetical protein Egran_03321 [Elaphomyces granulatus]
MWLLRFIFAAVVILVVVASPFIKRDGGPRLAINVSFPDPGFVGDQSGMWYAFATNGNGKRVQVASSMDFETWDLLDIEALATLSLWETDVNHWAPDVVRRYDGKYVLYYAGEAKEMIGHHCVGAAISEGEDPKGPYNAQPNAFACNLDQGGSIDPSGFLDRDGTRYVVYKIDGNSIGNGGNCNNGIPPLKSTPIMLQEVAEDAVTPVGEPIQILDRDDSDGPLVEAPNLILWDDTYFLFYSSHCFNDVMYDVRYVTSGSITGPYTKMGQLLKTGDYGLISPGGATACICGDRMLFHANCDQGRCLYQTSIEINNGTVSIV